MKQQLGINLSGLMFFIEFIIVGFDFYFGRQCRPSGYLGRLSQFFCRKDKINMKAIITDLDRTLLRTDKTVSEYTYAVLKNVMTRESFLWQQPPVRKDVF